MQKQQFILQVHTIENYMMRNNLLTEEQIQLLNQYEKAVKWIIQGNNGTLLLFNDIRVDNKLEGSKIRLKWLEVNKRISEEAEKSEEFKKAVYEMLEKIGE